MSITARSKTNYQVEIHAGNHQLISDEPVGVGDDAGPSPFDLLQSALASCTIITLHMYARRKGWPLEQVEAAVDLRSSETRMPDGTRLRDSVIDLRLQFHGELTPEQVQRLEEIAARCPVHRTLLGKIDIVTVASHA